MASFFIDQLSATTRSLTPWTNYNASDDYIDTIQDYEPNNQIETQHDLSRFGRTNDIAALYNEENKAIQREYIEGIVIGALLVLAVAIVWFIIILILNCLGEKRVGFFAGSFTHPSSVVKRHEDGQGVEVVTDKEKVQDTTPAVDPVVITRFNRRVGIVRVLFVCCGLAVIVSGLIFYLRGVAMFRDSITDVHIGVSAIQDVIKNAINFTDTLFEVQEELDFTLYASEANETAICNVPDQICAVRPVICEKAEDISSQVRDTIGTLIGQIKDLRVQLDGTLDGVSDDLQTVHDMTEDVTGYLELSNIFFIVLISITVVLSALVVAMIVSVFLAWKGIQNCFTKCIQYAIIWPVFILLLILSWIFAMLFLATSVAGADFCMDPDKHVQALLEIGVYGADGASAVESIAVDLIMFYIQGCIEENPITDIATKVEATLGQALTSTHQLITYMKDLPVDTLVQVCGMSTADANALSNMVEFADRSTHTLQRIFVALMDVLRCKTFHSIYSIFVHSAFCSDGISGMAYIFEASIVCAVFCMMMIVLRAAMYPVKESTAAPRSGDLDIVEAVKFQDEQPTTEPPTNEPIFHDAVETADDSLHLPVQPGMDDPSSEAPLKGSGTTGTTEPRTNVK